MNECNFKTFDVNIQIENTTENFKIKWKYLLMRWYWTYSRRKNNVWILSSEAIETQKAQEETQRKQLIKNEVKTTRSKFRLLAKLPHLSLILCSPTLSQVPTLLVALCQLQGGVEIFCSIREQACYKKLRLQIKWRPSSQQAIWITKETETKV